MVAGDPERVQDLLAAEVSKRFHAPPSAPADLVIVGNHPGRATPCRASRLYFSTGRPADRGGVLVGLFWTDPAEIDRSFPIFALRTNCGDRCSWGLDDSTSLAGRPANRCGLWLRQRSSCSAGHASWLLTVRCLSIRHRFTTASGLVWVLSAFSPIKPRYGERPPGSRSPAAGSRRPSGFASFPREG